MELRRHQREIEELEHFACKICLEGFEEDGSDAGAQDEIMPLQLCEHIFHTSCLVSYLKSRIDESKLPLICPDVICKAEIGDLDLKELLNEADYTKYSNFSLDAAIGA